MRANVICPVLAAALAVAGCAAPPRSSVLVPMPSERGSGEARLASPAAPVTSTPSTAPTATTPATPAESPIPPTQPADAGTPAQPASFTDTQMQFAFDVLNQSADANAGRNVFISAPNISLALAIAANGAKGETFDAVAAPLSGQGATLAQMNHDFAALQTMLMHNNPGLTLTLANSLWVNAGPPLNTDFVQRAEQYYSATLQTLDFSLPQSADEINQWVSKATNGKIPAVVDQLPADVVLLIVSAIYFKAAWQRPFQAGLTQDAPFNLAAGGQITAPMMQQSGSFAHLKNEQFEAVALPYAGSTARMVVMLPAPESDVDALRKQLTPQNWRAWTADFAPAQGTLRLPRFKTTFEITLNDALKNLGMGIAFDAQRADFSGMRPTPPALFISEVKHSSVIDVNEAGTEAAAATTVSMGVTSAMPVENPFEMTVDRPFLFAIEDAQTGALLFQGIIHQP